MGATVKQFLDTLEEMRSIYPFEDDKTRLSTNNRNSFDHNALTIVTKDERTGVWVEMSKDILPVFIDGRRE